MILCDTGLIVAALNVRDKNNAISLQALDDVAVQFLTTWPCLTEAMHIVRVQAGIGAQEKLLAQVVRRVYGLVSPTAEDAARACELMRQYADTPMDFADASLVVAAENLGLSKILTFDHHFFAYRIKGKIPFVVLPN